MSSSDQMVERAVRETLRPNVQAQPTQQPQIINIPAEGMAALVREKVLTAQQCFDLAFRGKPPAEYLGPKDLI